MHTQQERRRKEPRQSSTSQPHVVIVGGGFAGLQAAVQLRNAPVQVTVIDRTNHHVFQPLLYQVATATLSPGEISTPIRQVLRKQKNTQVMMAEVTGVDVQDRRVLIGERSLPYDYLVLATGARENYFGHEEWRTEAPGLKSLEDAREIRQKILRAYEMAEQESDPERIQQLMTFVIVGAGPTGVEMAGAMAEVAFKVLKPEFRHIDTSKTRIILIEAGPRILTTFPEGLARKAQKKLERMGVEVKGATLVTEIDEQGVIADGERIAAHTVLWTGGVLASPAAQWLGVEADRAGRVKVEGDLSAPGHPEVFVIGDTASILQDGKPVPGVSPAAMQQGKYVGQLIRQRVTRPEKAQPGKPFRYWNKGDLAAIGRSFAIFHLGKIRLAGFLAWLLWMAVHIYYLIDFENRILVMLRWAWAYLTYRHGVRIITIWGEKAYPATQQEEPEHSNEMAAGTKSY